MTIKLYIFDLNGTLANTPFIDHQPLAPLPGRKEKIAELLASGAKIAIASNQGGVAFGYQTPEQAREEVMGLASSLGITHIELAFGHPKPKWGYEEYGMPKHMERRKPEAGMLLAAMKEYGISPEETLMVGDRDEDQGAAEKAGCHFMWTQDFFGSYSELLGRTYELFQRVCKERDDMRLALVFIPSGGGQLEMPGLGDDDTVHLAVWTALPFAPGAIEEYLKRLEMEKKSDDYDPFLDLDDLP